MVLIDELAQVVARGSASGRLGLDLPLSIPIGSTDKGLDGASLPLGPVIEYGEGKSRFQLVVGRCARHTISVVPCFPVGFASSLELEALDHLLGGCSIATIDAVVLGILVTTRRIVVVKRVSDALLVVAILEDGPLSARGEWCAQVGGHLISHRHDLECGIVCILPSLGIEHDT